MSGSNDAESTPSLTEGPRITDAWKVGEKEQVTHRRTFSGMFFKVTLPLELLANEWPLMGDDEKYLQVAKRLRPHGDPPQRGEMGRKLERELAQILKHIDTRSAAGQFTMPNNHGGGATDGD